MRLTTSLTGQSPASVGVHYKLLLCQITALRLSDPSSGGWEDDQCRQLSLLGAEQLFSVTYREASGPHGEDQPGHTRPLITVMSDPSLGLCVVQLTGQAGAGLEAHTMCLGEANEPSQVLIPIL